MLKLIPGMMPQHGCNYRERSSEGRTHRTLRWDESARAGKLSKTRLEDLCVCKAAWKRPPATFVRIHIDERKDSCFHYGATYLAESHAEADTSALVDSNAHRADDSGRVALNCCDHHSFVTNASNRQCESLRYNVRCSMLPSWAGDVVVTRSGVLCGGVNSMKSERTWLLDRCQSIQYACTQPTEVASP